MSCLLIIGTLQLTYSGTTPLVFAQNEAPVMVEQFLEPFQFGDLPVGEFDVDLLMWDGTLPSDL